MTSVRIIPIAVSGAVAAAFLAIMFVPRLVSGGISAPFWLTAAAALVMMTGGVAVLRGFCSPFMAVRMTFPAILFVASAFGFLLLLETSQARYGLTILVAALVALYFYNLRVSTAMAPRDAADIANLSHALHILAIFFLHAFFYGITAYAHVSLPLRAVVTGAAVGFSAAETLRYYGAARKDLAPAAIVLGLIAAELFAALSFLPTSALVNAAAAVILLVFAFHAARQILAGIESGFWRRQAVFSAALLFVVFFTAQWV